MRRASSSSCRRVRRRWSASSAPSPPIGSLHTDRLAKLPDDVDPSGALRALQRVAFGMVALAQEPPDTTAALTSDELDGALLEDDVQEWLEWQLGYVDP